MAVKRGELIRNAQCIIERTPTATKSEEILSLTADQSCSEAKALPVLICILLYLRLHCMYTHSLPPQTQSNTRKHKHHLPEMKFEIWATG